MLNSAESWKPSLRERGSWARLWAREGLPPGWQWAVFAVSVLVIISRGAGVLTRPQFFAEDGAIWYGDAYRFGWLHSLLFPDGGYLNTLPRLAAALALLVPFHDAPLLLNCIGIVIQALPVTILLSGRCASWGRLPLRASMAAAYLALPNSYTIHVMITNAQWHLALVLCLLMFAADPNGWLWKAWDVVIFAVGAVSGPFCILLFPFGAIYWLRQRRSWTLRQLLILGSGALVQGAAILSPHSSPRIFTPLGASVPLFIRLVGAQIFLGALHGSNTYATRGPFLLLFVFFLAVFLVLLVALWKAPLPVRLFIGVSLATLAAELVSPDVDLGGSRWYSLGFDLGSRYWFFPMLAFVWSLLWCAFSHSRRALRVAATVAVLLMLQGVVRDWEVPPFPDTGFPQHAAAFEHARPGTPISVPLWPYGWYLRVIKK
jgi:hypothetical protein